MKQIISAQVPVTLFQQLETLAKDLDRSKSWIIKQALTNFLYTHERRRLDIQHGLADVDMENTVSQQEIIAWVKQIKAAK